MDLTTLKGRLFALVLMGTDAQGEDDWAVFSGTARPDGARLFVDRRGKPTFEVRSEWLARIKAVEPDLRTILGGADYFVALTVGDLPAGSDTEDFLDTGLKWPD